MGYALEDRYDLEQGRGFLTGVQAVVRTAIDQRRADRRAGIASAAFASGYPGSPLAGLDREFERVAARLGELGIVHQPGLNEELAATSVWGSQLVEKAGGGDVEGVVGIWYGKAPGLDRSGDAIRHANYGGTHPRGGVLAVVGEDPACKSSTVPSVVEGTLADLLVPTFAPGNVAEIVALGLHGIACSRAAGTWSALKLPTNVVDGAGTVELDSSRVVPVPPAGRGGGEPYRHLPRADLTGPVVLGLEQSLFEVRIPLAAEYARCNDLNPITVRGPRDWIGIAAPGKTYYEVRQALDGLGLDAAACRAAGIRLLKIGMPYPLDREVVREFAAGLAEVVVVEDKVPFLERAVKDALYGTADAPAVHGRFDDRGAILFPSSGELLADAIAPPLAARLGQRVERPSIDRRLAALEAAAAVADRQPPVPVRTPFFCSGCPHNTSTGAGDDELVGAGIGCHSMVLLAESGKGRSTGLTQMGGEGAQWIGMAPFADRPHFVQNLGDGTFHHSGSLAIRAAVAAGVNVTFKVLYNGTVAMTGGQAVAGALSVDKLTEWLALEGVARTIVTADDTGRYADVTLAANAELRPRDGLAGAQAELAKVPGVTVLIHDQMCAAEKRRLRKRGRYPKAARKVHINERVCEGCGDCGVKSNCLSVQPVDTPLGRKTQIHLASCNDDYSCLEGDCPSFLTVVPGRGPAGGGERDLMPEPAPEPARADRGGETTVRMVGIGGTGVVTVSQILGVAALLEGRHVWSLDQTGLSQKGGPVISDVRVSEAPIVGSNRVGVGGADVFLGFDLLGAGAPGSAASIRAGETVAVVSTSAVPTGQMVVDGSIGFPAPEGVVAALGERTAAASRSFDAQALSLELFDDHMPSNLIVLGAAYQLGVLPAGAAALHEAIGLAGGKPDVNLAAFEWGRVAVARPAEVEAVIAAEAEDEPEVGEDLDSLVAWLAADLLDYQDERYAAAFRAFVDSVRRREGEVCPGAEEVTRGAARGLHKLMAYKDEYEVARLHLDPAERDRIARAFGPDARVSWNLHPPFLRALGMERKIELGPWFEPGFKALRAARRLRGTKVDPFGWAAVRRVERELIGRYKTDLGAALRLLSADNHEAVAALARLPEMVRGYEGVKLRNVAAYERSMAAALADLKAPGTLPLEAAAS